MNRLLERVRFFWKWCMATARFWATSIWSFGRTQATFVMFGEAPIIACQCNRSHSCGLDTEDLATLAQSVATSCDSAQLHVMGSRLERIAIKSRTQALINEQAVFRRMRLTSSGSEGWHRSVRCRQIKVEPFKNSVVVWFTTFVSQPPDDRSVRGNSTLPQLHSFRVGGMF